MACPVCEAALERRQYVFACEKGHSFDIANEGYVNLLPSQHKRRGVEGDTRAMLLARRQFLGDGHVAPLLDALVEQVGTVLSLGDSTPGPTVVKVGSGEGYYIGSIQTRLAGVSRAGWFGTDISKPAVAMAAKRYHDVQFFVSDTHTRLYLQDASMDLLLDVFAPRNPSEFSRVVKLGSVVLVVIPAQAHLGELRATLGPLEIEPEKEQKVLERFAHHFRLIGGKRPEYSRLGEETDGLMEELKSKQGNFTNERSYCYNPLQNRC